MKLKKALMILLTGFVAVSLVGCQSNEETSQKEEQPQTTDTSKGLGKTLVVYYSATGNTENVAKIIAEKTNGQLFKIEPKDTYSGDDLDWTNENSRVTREYENESERNVELVSTNVDDWNTYETVFIGYPIWWGIAAWPVDNFVKNNDFTGKKVIPFCTSSSSSLGESGELLSKMAGTGDWQEGKRFSSGASSTDIQEWLDELK